jgi:Fe-S oxidoreductase
MKRFLEKLSSVFSNIVYYPGCLTRFVLPNIQKNYENILEAVGIDFVTVEELKCCGSPVRNAGYEEEFQYLKETNKQLFKEYGVSKIITNCPACYNILKEIHPKTFHVTEILHKRLHVKNSWNANCTYHDPCHLGRYAGLYDEPRAILETCGFELVEMEWCREKVCVVEVAVVSEQISQK